MNHKANDACGVRKLDPCDVQMFGLANLQAKPS
jgi:hypothetical protein